MNPIDQAIILSQTASQNGQSPGTISRPITPDLLPDSGAGIGYTEKRELTICMADVDNSQFTVSGVGFSHVSDLVPTKEQLVGNMRFYLVDQFGEESESHDLYIKEAIFDDDMVYGGALYYGNDILSGMYVSVAYKSGVWNGMEIPKTGLFIHKPDLGEADPNAYFELKYEAVHGVDPKFLPEGGFGYLGKEGYVKVLDSSDVGEKIESSDTSSEGYLYSKNILKEGNQYRVFYMDDVYEITCVRVDTSNGTILMITGNGFSVGEGIVEGELVRLIECGIGGIETIVIEEWQSEVHKIDPMFIPDDFGGYWFDDINFVYALLGTGGQAGKLEYTLAPAVYASMVKAIQDGTFKGVLFSMEGQTMRLLADTGLSYLNGVSEFVLNVPTGITDEHMTYDKIVVRLIEDGTVLVDYVDDERDIIIDMTDIFQEEAVPYRLYTERAQLLDHFAKRHRPITCAVDIDGYICNVTLSYSSSEFSTQYVGSFQGYIFVITFADGAWEAVKLREGVGILETSLPKDGSKVMLSEKDILYLTGAMEMNAMGPINVYINVEGEGACIAPMKIYHHMDGSEIMCVETSTKRCFIGQTEEGVYAWAEDLISELKAYAESLQIAGDKITEFDIPIQNEKVQCPVPREELIGMKVRTEVNAYRFNSAPVKPESDEEIHIVSYADGNGRYTVMVGYHDAVGKIGKKALFIQLMPYSNDSDCVKNVLYSMCPAFADVYAGYNTVMYCFEQTSDTMGLGLVVEPGWYAANSETFAMTPFDIERYPIRIFDDMIADGEVSVDEYLYQTTTHEGTETITLTEDNFDEERVVVSLSPISETVYEYLESLISGKLYEEVVKFQHRYHLFYLEEDGWIYVNSTTIVGDKTYGSKKTTLLINSIQKVDPKYLPDTVATKDDVATAVSETKEYVDRICRIENKTHKYRITFDENTNVDIIEKFEMAFLKLSDDVIDLTKAVSARFAGETEDGFVSDSVYDKLITGQQDGMTVIFNAETETMLAVSSAGPESETTLPTGLWYVLETSTGTFGGIKWIEFSVTTENIHPIDPKFLLPSRYFLDLTNVTLPEINDNAYVAVLMGLALNNGGTYSTTVPAENCTEFYTQAQKWAKLSQEGYYVGELSEYAPQLVLFDNSGGMQLIPTAIYQIAEWLHQIYVSGTLRMKDGGTFVTATANCTIIFNENGSVEFFVTATTV